jgi:hypothetical protein
MAVNTHREDQTTFDSLRKERNARGIAKRGGLQKSGAKLEA